MQSKSKKQFAKGRFVYEGERTKEISFPLGGIGTGSIGFGGNGRLMDWEIFNRPNKGSLAGMSHLAIRAENKDGVLSTRILNSDIKKDLVGQYSKKIFNGYGFGPSGATMVGFPHFRRGSFIGKFPIARLELEEDEFPGKAAITAFNPFLPLNDKDSSLPAAFFEVEVENNTSEELGYTIAFSVQNPSETASVNRYFCKDGISGISLDQADTQPCQPEYGNLTVATDAENITYQEYWYRGTWSDGGSVFWRNFSTGALKNRTYQEPGNRDMCTLAATVAVRPGEKQRVKFLLSWNYPNCYNYWNPCLDENGEDIQWKNYYATLFPHSADTALYALKEWDRLFRGTKEFQNALFSSTLPEEALDAISSTISVLKSPTVLRLEDGSFYGWEGVHEQAGSCEGSCTHVWNYAYALPFLFPSLERSMRELDYRYNQWPDGKMTFRLALPIGREPWTHRACVDGQMGGVIKTYREWKLCGDDEWLKKLWPSVKKSLEYAWIPSNPDHWDADRDGVLEGRQHHTLDMELFGPSSWLEGFYLAALKAAAEMAEAMGEPEDAKSYLALFEKGKAWCDKNLFNGVYYEHAIDLTDKSLLTPYEDAERVYWNKEAGEIKYQIAHGSAIDQVIGQWHANLCGLGEIFDKKQLHSALRSIYHTNYKTSFRNFANPFRIFCLDDESGTVICDYPKGVQKPVIPVPYCEETMHGFEYQAAALMISEGMAEEGMELVAAVRDRYTGENRNPWNEFECGSNYARSMASFSLLPLTSRFSFDMRQGKIGFDPMMEFAVDGEFRSFWSVDSAWGTLLLTEKKMELTVKGGCLPLRTLVLPFLSVPPVCVEADQERICPSFKAGELSWGEEPCQICRSLVILR